MAAVGVGGGLGDGAGEVADAGGGASGDDPVGGSELGADAVLTPAGWAAEEGADGGGEWGDSCGGGGGGGRMRGQRARRIRLGGSDWSAGVSMGARATRVAARRRREMSVSAFICCG